MIRSGKRSHGVIPASMDLRAEGGEKLPAMRSCEVLAGQDQRTDGVGAAQGTCAARGEGVWSHNLPKPRSGEGWQAVHRKELWHA